MRRRYRLTAFATAGVLLTGGLAACAAPAPAPSASAEEEPMTSEITVGVQAWMITKGKFDKVVENFEKANVGKKVNLVEYADNQTLANYALQWSQKKTSVDVVVVGTCSQAVQFLPKKLIIDFKDTKFFEGETAKDKFVPTTLEGCELDGTQYGVPIALEVYGISANKSFFEGTKYLGADGEITPPKNWNELYEMAKALTVKEGDRVVRPGMIIQWGSNGFNTMLALQKSLTGSFYKKDGKTLTFDSPEVRSVLQTWRKGVEEGVFSIATFTDKNAGQNAMNSGQLPLLLQSAAGVPESVPTIGADNARFIPLPGSMKNGSRGGPGGIIIPQATTNKALALKFIKEGLMSDVQVDVGTQWGKLPVLTKWFDKIDAPWKEPIFEIAKKATPSPEYKDLPKLQLSVVRDLQVFLAGDMDLETFVSGIEKQIADAEK